ncbi:MAG: hypothetical protein KDK39_06020, partial [Leptospiraceae bacterium]|nr:hypothetical protein [Leptospiraceae bacterium]
NGRQTIAFSGDTAWGAALIRLVEHVDLALLELSLPEQPADPVSHISLAEALEVHNQLAARRIVWTHCYDELAEQARVHGLEVAWDGMRIPLAWGNQDE